MVRVITIVCDNSKAWQPTDFSDMFHDMLWKCLEYSGDGCPYTKAWDFSKCLLDSGQKLPSKGDADAFIISGSRHNVRDGSNLSWFEPLCSLIRDLEGQAGKSLIGVCFGSQIVAHALGGEVDKNPCDLGFILLAETLHFTPALRTQLGRCCRTAVKKIGSEEGIAKLLVSHGDSCVKLPPHATLLASSGSCMNEMYTCGGNILCCQGHPEFELDYAISQRIWPAVVEKNRRLSEEKIEIAKASFVGYSQPFDTVIMLIVEFIASCSADASAGHAITDGEREKTSVR